MDIRITQYSIDRRQEIVDLLNIGLGTKYHSKRSVAYWIWKHEQNPFGQSLLLLAECEGKIVGVRAFLRWRLRVGSRSVEVGKPVDSVTHPDFQRRGIFRRLTKAACEHAKDQGICLLFNTPNQNSEPGYLKLGWRRTGMLTMRVKLLRPSSMAWRMLKHKFRPMEDTSTAHFFRAKPVSADTIVLSDELRVAHLVEQPDTDSLVTERTIDFLRWRYCHHPHVSYFAETMERNGRLDGLLFYRTNMRHGAREIMIDDVIAAPNNPECLPKLLAQLRTRVRADYLIACVSSSSPESAAFRAFGFRQVVGRRVSLLTRSLNGTLTPDPTILDNWSLRLGDLEGL